MNPIALAGFLKGNKAGDNNGIEGLDKLLKGIEPSATSFKDRMKEAVAGFNQLSFAANQVTGSFNMIVDKASKYTEAINPALIQNINLAFRDLNAVIGVMAQEITQAAIPVVRAFADTLLPVMRQLQPLMDTLANSVSQVLQTAIVPFGNILQTIVPYAKIWADVFEQMAQPLQMVGERFGTLVTALSPLLDALSMIGGTLLTTLGSLVEIIMGLFAPVLALVTTNLSILANIIKLVIGISQAVMAPFTEALKGLGAIATDFGRVLNVLVAVVVAVVEAITQSILAIFGDTGKGMRDTMKNLQDSFRQLAKAVLLTVAQIMKAIGFTDGLQAMIRAIEGNKQDSRGMAVAQSPAFKAIEQVGKDLSLSSFTASAQGAKEKGTDDFLKDILTDLKGIADSNKTPEILSMVDKLPEKLAKAIIDALASQAEKYKPSPIGVAAISPGAGAAMWAVKKLRGG